MANDLVMLPDKARVVSALRAAVAEELAAFERLAEQARDEVTSDQTRQEGQYDTRATEASYLARGQAARIVELRRLVAWVDVFDPRRALDEPVVQSGALVVVQGPRTDVIFIAPAGGNRLDVDGIVVRVVSPVSPLGAALADLAVGDAFEVDTPRGVDELEVIAVR